MKNDKLKGALLITFGAGCYGMLGTYVKMAYLAGFNTAEVTISQFSLGVTGLFILTLFQKGSQNASAPVPAIRSKMRLTIAGTSLGLTSVFYYLSVKYIPVSVAIVLLAQSVWMGVLLESIVRRKVPAAGRLLSVTVIMAGTLLATAVLKQSVSLSWKGFAFGIAGALCYTATMYSTNHLDTHFPPLKRSLYMIAGGLIIILCVFHAFINTGFSWKIFPGWGLLVSLFGTVLPPLLFTRGMPLAGMGLGAILASIEIPVSIIMAKILLHEQVITSQWIGVGLIMGAVVLMNIPRRNISNSNSK